MFAIEYDPEIDPDDLDDDDFLTEWERSFLDSISCWDGDLTDRQEEKLAEIQQALEDRRQLYREGRYPFGGRW
jgi:hypothetical protein